jgi:hypothetical protein
MKLLKDVFVTAECEEVEGKEVWSATSKTLPGLFLEAGSFKKLCKAIQGNVPLLVNEMKLLTSKKLTIHLKLAGEIEFESKIAA